MAWTRRLPDGRHRGVYRDELGKERSKTFELRRDAKKWAIDEEAKARGRSGTQSGNRLFRDYAEEWKDGQIHRRGSTRAATESLLRARIYPELGEVKLGAIETRRLQAWVGRLNTELSAETIGKAVRLVRQVLDSAVSDGLLATNPAKAVNLPVVEQPDVSFLTKDEVKAALAVVQDLEYGGRTGTYAAAFMTLCMCGLRFGEAAALQPSDIVKDASGVRVLRVRRTLGEVRGELVEGPVKTTAGRRDVPVPPRTWDMIEEHVENTNHFRRENDLGRDRLLLSPKNRSMRGSTFRRDVMGPVSTELGRDIRTHDLRHTAVSLWIAEGFDVKTIAALAGHRSVSTVLDRYGHLVPSRAVDLMSGPDLDD